MAAAAATIASTALPPSRSTAAPAWAARWWGAVTMPPRLCRLCNIGKSPGANRSIHQRYMRGHHTPTLARHAHPGLLLAARAGAALARELGAGGGAVAPVGGDAGVVQRPRQPGRRTAAAKGTDRVDAVEAFRGAVAHGVRAVEEQRVQHVHFVVDQRMLVARKRSRDLGEDIGQ